MQVVGKIIKGVLELWVKASVDSEWVFYSSWENAEKDTQNA